MNQWMSVAEVATYVGVSRQRVHQRIRGQWTSKPLPHIVMTVTNKKGQTRNLIRIHSDDATAWLNSERRGKKLEPVPAPVEEVAIPV